MYQHIELYKFIMKFNHLYNTLGAVTLTMVNAISHGKLSRGASHLSFSIPR